MLHYPKHSMDGNIIKHTVTSVLNRVLRDTIYIGKVCSKKDGTMYDGVHEPIIDRKTFDAVQEKLSSQNNRGDVTCAQGTAPLHNKITDAAGNILQIRKISIVIIN